MVTGYGPSDRGRRRASDLRPSRISTLPASSAWQGADRAGRHTEHGEDPGLRRPTSPVGLHRPRSVPSRPVRQSPTAEANEGGFPRRRHRRSPRSHALTDFCHIHTHSYPFRTQAPRAYPTYTTATSPLAGMINVDSGRDTGPVGRRRNHLPPIGHWHQTPPRCPQRPVQASRERLVAVRLPLPQRVCGRRSEWRCAGRIRLRCRRAPAVTTMTGDRRGRPRALVEPAPGRTADGSSSSPTADDLPSIAPTPARPRR